MSKSPIKYQPSNGTEGMIFTDQYCMQCKHCDPNPEGEKQCDILLRTLVHDINDEEYPSEWTYSEKDVPVCTKWEKWNWGSEENPTPPEEPEFIDTNQLNLFD